MRKIHRMGFGGAGRERGIICLAAVVLVLVAVPRIAPAVPGDTEPNEAVDLRDLLTIRNAVGEIGAPGFIGADVDSNGIVDSADLLLWRQNFPFLGTPLAPYLFIASPLDGSLIGDRRPTIVIDYGATSLNVDPSSLQVIVDGVDRSADALRSFTNAMLPIDESLGDGPHVVEVTVADVQGTPTTDRSDFEVTAITLLPKATPRIGPAPLEVVFAPDVVWADVAPAWYRWDWEDDAVYNVTDPRPDLRTNTFFEEGLHTIRFQVQQSDGTLTDTTLTVAVTENFASVSPSNGNMPLTVFLHGIAADLDDPITLYEWDFDFDGSFNADYFSATDPNLGRVYPLAGIYRPVFRTTHLSGAVVEHPIVQEELEITSFGSPMAVAAASQGVDALTVNFSGNGSDNGSIILYQWDFDNDGVWDYSDPTTGTVSHTYPTAGIKVAAFQVTDNDMNTTGDRVRFETFAPATLEVLDDTVIPENNEMVTIRTTLTIDSTVRLYVRAADQTLTTGEVVTGRVIRTLVDNEVRPAGVYDDTWDGRDFRFEPEHPGAYYAVLEYSYPGRTDTLDLAESTGGNHFFAPRVPPVETQFDPIDDNPLPMRFSISGASRASLYILPGGTNRAATLFDNLALGAGEYLYFWAGFASDGQFANAATYLWSVNAWTLADNVIVVRGGPEVSDILITPNRLSPTDRPMGSATMDIAFTLSKPSSLLAKIVNIDDNLTVRSFQLPDLPSGANSFVWDGKTVDGTFASPGFYRLSLFAADAGGNLSIEREGVMQIRY